MSAEVKNTMSNNNKGIKAPNTLVLLCIFILVVSVLTYIIPAGSFDRSEDPASGRNLVVAGSYHAVDANPVTPFEIFMAIPKGMEQAAYVIFFLFIIGGAFRILQATGAIETGIGNVVRKLEGKETLIIPVIMVIFALGGSILGVAEEALAFMPMVVMLCLALGFDSITGAAVLLLSSAAGYAGATLNPFTVGLAQGISGLPLFSGLGYRMICFGIITTVTITYVYLYARKIKRNPELSPMYHEDKKLKFNIEANEFGEFTTRHKMVLLTLLVGIVFLAYGVLKLGFYITELGAIFLIIGIVAGLIGGLRISEVADEFVLGAKDLLYACLIVGFARAMLVIMSDGNILDSIIYSAAQLISGLPPTVSAVAMFIVQSLTNIVIPSGSGQAAVSMPIMAPLADAIGVPRQTAVLAYQLGDAFSNVMTPTSGFFMAGIAMCGITWTKWAKWLLPLFAMWCVLGATLVAVSVMIGYGPF